MWLFGYAKDFRRKITKAVFFKSENNFSNYKQKLNLSTRIDTFDAKSSRYPNSHQFFGLTKMWIFGDTTVYWILYTVCYNLTRKFFGNSEFRWILILVVNFEINKGFKENQEMSGRFLKSSEHKWYWYTLGALLVGWLFGSLGNGCL